MKKLTREQKQLIKAGSSIAGIVQGTAAIIYSINMAIDLGTRYFAWDEKSRWNNYSERKFFINSSSQKVTIFS